MVHWKGSRFDVGIPAALDKMGRTQLPRHSGAVVRNAKAIGDSLRELIESDPMEVGAGIYEDGVIAVYYLEDPHRQEKRFPWFPNALDFVTSLEHSVKGGAIRMVECRIIRLDDVQFAVYE